MTTTALPTLKDVREENDFLLFMARYKHFEERDEMCQLSREDYELTSKLARMNDHYTAFRKAKDIEAKNVLAHLIMTMLKDMYEFGVMPYLYEKIDRKRRIKQAGFTFIKRLELAEITHILKEMNDFEEMLEAHAEGSAMHSAIVAQMDVYIGKMAYAGTPVRYSSETWKWELE